jgi:CubicO group peptidase (beta-lactamase class C family)
MITGKQKIRPCLAVAMIIALAELPKTALLADPLPVTGVPVPELADFDLVMNNIMTVYGLERGVLAVSKDGDIIYQRGFGWLRDSYPLPENTPMRVASVEKPLTAATVRKLAALGYFSLSDFVFDLGQPGGGILEIDPWPSLGDERLKDITVEHLLLHRGGWDMGAINFDPQGKALEIATAMGIHSPPGRFNTARYMLGQPLQYDPGTLGCTNDDGDPISCYSNLGFMLLGLIVEQEAGAPHADRILEHVLTPELWVPATELFPGRTFQADQSPREPIYDSDRWLANVFYPYIPPIVNSPYGSWDHEALTGHGNLVVSAAPLLTYLRDYVVIGDSIGMPLNGGTNNGGHAGLLDGTSTIASQRADGICIVVLMTRRHWGDDPHYAGGVAGAISALIDSTTYTWPTFCVDGSWVDFNASSSGYGGYDDPFHTMDAALAATSAGTKLRVKAGASNWTGTLATRMRIDAPFGLATIGQ